MKVASTPLSAPLPDMQVESSKHHDLSNIDSKSITDDKMESPNEPLSSGRSDQFEDNNEEAITNSGEAQIVDTKDDNAIKAKVYQNQGDVFTASSKYEEAIENYEKAQNINPVLEVNENEMMAYQGLANNLLKNGKYEESINNYKKALELAPKRGNKKKN